MGKKTGRFCLFFILERAYEIMRKNRKAKLLAWYTNHLKMLQEDDPGDDNTLFEDFLCLEAEEDVDNDECFSTEDEWWDAMEQW